MIINEMFKLILKLFFILFALTNLAHSDENFNNWVNSFKIKAISYGISEKVVNEIMTEARYLPKVIEYDRYQPEFYEDTFTYIKKRSSKRLKRFRTL